MKAFESDGVLGTDHLLLNLSERILFMQISNSWIELSCFVCIKCSREPWREMSDCGSCKKSNLRPIINKTLLTNGEIVNWCTSAGSTVAQSVTTVFGYFDIGSSPEVR